jgi:nicotinamidase/pyrazinamidase
MSAQTLSDRIVLPARQLVASFDVDAQRTFTPICPDELPVIGGDEIAGELNLQAAFASLRVGSKDAHSVKALWMAGAAKPALSAIPAAAATPNLDVYWPAHAIVGTNGFELLEGLPRPIDYDYFVWKGIEIDLHPYGACYHDLANTRSTGVIEFLKSRGIKTVIVGGLALDYCVATTATQLQQAGFEVIINLAATRGISEATSERAQASLRTLGVRFAAHSASFVQEGTT